MKFARAVIAAIVLLSFWEPALHAQAADARQVINRLDALEESVDALSRQVAELSTLLRAALPPSPIENIPPFDLAVPNAAFKGSKDAKVALIEFSDFECPFCGRNFQAVYPELQRQFVETGKVVYVFRNLPLETIHPLAFKAAEAGECAREQWTFWEMHDRLFANQQALAMSDLLRHAQALELDLTAFQSCLADGKTSAKVREDLDEARRLGLTGTPTFMIGEVTEGRTVRVTKRIAGAQPLQVFQAALQSVLIASTTATTK